MLNVDEDDYLLTQLITTLFIEEPYLHMSVKHLKPLEKATTGLLFRIVLMCLK